MAETVSSLDPDECVVTWKQNKIQLLLLSHANMALHSDFFALLCTCLMWISLFRKRALFRSINLNANWSWGFSKSITTWMQFQLVWLLRAKCPINRSVRNLIRDATGCCCKLRLIGYTYLGDSGHILAGA